MSKKAQQNAIKKRNKRAEQSRVKRSAAQAARIGVPRGTIISPQHKFDRRMDRLHDAMVRNGLEDPVGYLRSGGKIDKSLQMDPMALVQEAKERIGDVFKLFSFSVIAHRLIQKGLFEHEFTVDLPALAHQMVNIDENFRNLPNKLKENWEEFAIDMFDIGGEVEAVGTQLYDEFNALSKHHDLIEAQVTALAKEHAKETGAELLPVRNAAVEAIAYGYLDEVINHANKEAVVNE
jgi:hypothetical protein